MRVGLTGGIGAGKSTVARVFEVLGIPIYFSDKKAKRLMTKDLELVGAITGLLGNDAYDNNGELNRAYIGQQVFGNQELLVGLNALVHPAVRRDFDIWAKAQTSKYVINEAALHFETGGHERMDYNISVSAPEQVRLERVISRDGLSEEQVRARMSQQMSQEEKDRLADWVIYNDGTQGLIQQVLECHVWLLTQLKKADA